MMAATAIQTACATDITMARISPAVAKMAAMPAVRSLKVPAKRPRSPVLTAESVTAASWASRHRTSSVCDRR
jgi:hypothetical protein